MRLKGTSSDGVTTFSRSGDPDGNIVGPKEDLSSHLKNVGTNSGLSVTSGGVSRIEASRPHHSLITEKIASSVVSVIGPLTARPAGVLLTIVGGVPAISISASRNVVPVGAVLSLSGSAPLVLTPQSVAPAGAVLSLSGGTPAVAIGIVVRPSSASLSITGGTPVISLSDNKTAAPSSAALTITGGAPVVSTPRLVTPAAAALSIIGSAPAVILTNLVAPSGATLTITGGTPAIVVSNNITVAPSGASLAVTAGSPVVSTPRVVAPAGAALAVTGSAPVVGVSDRKVVTPSAASMTLTGGAPVVSVSNNKMVTPSGAVLTVTGGTPVVSTPRLVTTSGAALSVTGGTPVVTASNNKTVAPSGAALSITGGTPTVTVGAGLAFNAVGTGGSSAGGSPSWTHTASAGAYVIVGIVNANSAVVSSVTYGGTSMSLLGSIGVNNAPGNGHVFLYGLAGVSSGSQTVVVTPSSPCNIAGNSVSYTGVTSVGSAQTAFASGTSLSQSTSGGGSANLTAQVFGWGSSPTGSVYSATQRYNLHGSNGGLVIGDSSTANTTFTATLSASAGWGGVAVVLS